MKSLYPNIAFTGYSRTGKSTACDVLVSEFGYNKVAFGVILKRQVDPFVRAHLGFSAFTEVDSEKKKIRGLLECWGDTFYKAILKEFFENLPTRAANARLARVIEAREWVKRGGIIVELKRPGIDPATDWESKRMDEMRDSGLIGLTIEPKSKAELKERVRGFLTLETLKGDA